MREWARTWAENRLEVLGTVERGDVVVVESRWHLKAKTGGDIPLSDFNLVIWFDPDHELVPLRAAAFFERERALEAAVLADSPVNGCILFGARLGCLKKPTEEARGG